MAPLRMFPLLGIAGLVMLLMLPGCSDLGSNPAQGGGDPPPPPTTGSVSFSTDLKPILNRYGCTSCHGGNGGLYVTTVAQIKQGGVHGAAVMAGNSAGSVLVQKLMVTPPFGDRMPQGGPYLPDSLVSVIRQWIDQGAQDN